MAIGFEAILIVAPFVLGFFFDCLEITLLIVSVFAPVTTDLAPEFAVSLEIARPPMARQKSQMLLWFAILVALDLQTTCLTPPFGFARFYRKGIMPLSIVSRTSTAASFPF